MDRAVSLRGDQDAEIALSFGKEGVWDSPIAYWDEVCCLVTVHVGAFRGCYRTGLYTRTLLDLRDELTEAWSRLAGNAVFDGLDMGLNFAVSIVKTGRAFVEGKADDQYGHGNSLSFRFETDQTYLGETVKQLRQLTM
jgi:hypothetical protein